MASARQQLDEINERVRSGGRSGNDTSLPANYSDIIKAAQAEARASRSSPKRQADPWEGMRETSKPKQQSRSAPQPRNVPTPTSREEATAPMPSSRDAALEANQTDEASTGGVGGDTLLGILAGALGAGGAYALYKRLSRGDTDAINEAKTILSESANADADAKSTAVAEQGGRVAPSQSGAIDSARFGDDIVDADYEEMPDNRQITEQRRLASPDPRAGMDDYLDMLDQQTGMVEAPEPQKLLPAPDQDADAQAAVEGREVPRRTPPVITDVPAEDDIDTIVRQAIEEGTVAERSGRLKRVPTSQTPSPNIKPRIKPKA